jgi:hypothetical protein
MRVLGACGVRSMGARSRYKGRDGGFEQGSRQPRGHEIIMGIWKKRTSCRNGATCSVTSKHGRRISDRLHTALYKDHVQCTIESHHLLWCFYIGSCQVTFLVSSSKSGHLQTSFSARNSCLIAVNDVNEGRLQAGTTDKETVNVGLLSKLLAVLLGDTATVQDAGLLGSLG